MEIKTKKIAVIWKNNPDMLNHNRMIIDLIKKCFFNSDVFDYDGHKIKQEDISDKDLIINIAGDGHYLNTARFIKRKNQFIFGFNFEKSDSHGHYNLVKGNLDDLKRFIEKIKQGNVKVGVYHRLDVILNGKKVDVVLNEIWEKSVSGSSLRHEVEINGVKEKYIHGGFGVATVSGKSGLVSRVNPLPIDVHLNNKIIYRAATWTDDFKKIYGQRKLGLNGKSAYDGVLQDDNVIKIVSNNRPGSAHIVCDGRHELLPSSRVYKFDKGFVLEIKKSKDVINYLY